MNKSMRSKNEKDFNEGTTSRASFKHISPAPDSISRDGLLM